MDNPEKTHDFCQIFDKLFTRAIRGSIQARTRDLSGGRTSLRRLSHRSPLCHPISCGAFDIGPVAADCENGAV